MGLQAIDHFTIRTDDLAASRRFYVDILGLTDGDRPPFDFPGAWLYLDDRPVVHLIAGQGTGEKATGSIDHLAFRASAPDALRQRLNDQGVDFSERVVPRLEMVQFFIKDPDGVTIELNFLPDAG